MRTKRIKLYRYHELPSISRVAIMKQLLEDFNYSIDKANEIVLIKEFLKDGTIYTEK